MRVGSRLHRAANNKSKSTTVMDHKTIVVQAVELIQFLS
jgi:hypothetical protein